MQPFTRHTGVAAPLLKDDINTDQVAPILHTRGLKEDYRAMLFHRARRRDDGSEDPDFVLNKPQFRAAVILVTGQNFGAGSSRESAVWSMLANGIRVIVAKSFAEIYRENCLQNGLLPVVLGSDAADEFIARVIAADGQAIGEVGALLIDTSAWTINRSAVRAGQISVLKYPPRSVRGSLRDSTISD